MSPYHYEDENISEVPYLYGTMHKWMGNEKVIWELKEGNAKTVEQALQNIARKEQEEMDKLGPVQGRISGGSPPGGGDVAGSFDRDIENMIDEAALNEFFSEPQPLGGAPLLDPQMEMDMDLAGAFVDPTEAEALDAMMAAGQFPADETVPFNDLPPEMKEDILSASDAGLPMTMTQPVLDELAMGGFAPDYVSTDPTIPIQPTAMSAAEQALNAEFAASMGSQVVPTDEEIMAGAPPVSAPILPPVDFSIGGGPFVGTDAPTEAQRLENLLNEQLVQEMSQQTPGVQPELAPPGMSLTDIMAGASPMIDVAGTGMSAAQQAELEAAVASMGGQIVPADEDIMAGAALPPAAPFFITEQSPTQKIDYTPAPPGLEELVRYPRSPFESAVSVEDILAGAPSPEMPKATFSWSSGKPQKIDYSPPVEPFDVIPDIYDLRGDVISSAEKTGVRPQLSEDELIEMAMSGDVPGDPGADPFSRYPGGAPGDTGFPVVPPPPSPFAEEEALERQFLGIEDDLDMGPPMPGPKPTQGGHAGRLALQRWEARQRAWNDYWGPDSPQYVALDDEAPTVTQEKLVTKTSPKALPSVKRETDALKDAFIEAMNSDNPDSALKNLIENPPDLETLYADGVLQPLDMETVQGIFSLLKEEGDDDQKEVDAWNNLPEGQKKARGKGSKEEAEARLARNPYGTASGNVDKYRAFNALNTNITNWFEGKTTLPKEMAIAQDEFGLDADMGTKEDTSIWMGKSEGGSTETFGFKPPAGYNEDNGDSFIQNPNNPSNYIFTRGSGKKDTPVTTTAATTAEDTGVAAPSTGKVSSVTGTEQSASEAATVEGELLPADDWTRQMSNQDLFFSEFYKMPGSGTYDALRNRGKIWNQAETLYLLGHGIRSNELGDVTSLRNTTPNYGDSFRNFSKSYLANPEGLLGKVDASGNTFASTVAARAQEAANKLRAFETNVENVWGVDFMDWKSRNPNAESADGYYEEVAAKTGRDVGDIEKDWTRNVQDVALFHPYFGGDDRWRNTYKTVNTIGLDAYNASAIGNVLDMVADAMLARGKTYGEVLQRLTSNPMGMGMRGGTQTPPSKTTTSAIGNQRTTANAAPVVTPATRGWNAPTSRGIDRYAYEDDFGL